MPETLLLFSSLFRVGITIKLGPSHFRLSRIKLRLKCAHPDLDKSGSRLQPCDLAVSFPDVIVQRLNSDKRDAFCIESADVLIVITESERRSEVLGDRTEVANICAFDLISPSLNRQLHHLRKDVLSVHGLEVRFARGIRGVHPYATVGQRGARPGGNRLPGDDIAHMDPSCSGPRTV